MNWLDPNNEPEFDDGLFRIALGLILGIGLVLVIALWTT
jgi:hypothetical protein